MFDLDLKILDDNVYFIAQKKTGNSKTPNMKPFNLVTNSWYLKALIRIK